MFSLRSALGLEPDAEVPSNSGEALVPFVRQSLARNRQQMLATMVQMGMQSIVIDSGRINASMRFHIDATSAVEEDQSSRFDTRTTIGASGSFGFGLWSASASISSTIGYVSTDDVRTREDLTASADLNSSVELHFRTDQVPLDRIASQQTVDRLRLNTLNPERELDIARQADADRTSDRRQTEAAHAARPRLEAAAPAPPPPAPPSPSSPAAPARPGGGGTATAPASPSPASAGTATSGSASGQTPPAGGSADRPPNAPAAAPSGAPAGSDTRRGGDSATAPGAH